MFITLLTDFGTSDAYVAQMKGQILSICPTARLIDITHEIPAQDVRQAAIVLQQAAAYFPAGTIHLAVVDPGVGTSRQLLAVEAELLLGRDQSSKLQRFVLPDNGLVDLCLQGSRRWSARYLSNPDYWRADVSATFHGRDVMGPVAAHWANGVELTQFGPPCSKPISLNYPHPRLDGNSAELEVISVDHFGNLLTNLPAHQANFLTRESVQVAANDSSFVISISRTYGDVASGELLLLVGSHGLVEIAVARGDASSRLGLSTGQSLKISW